MNGLRSWYELGMRDGKVLIVEDDDDLRDLVRTVVEREGMATIEAADGREGLRQFYELRPSLLILDIGLPELDGWQAHGTRGAFETDRERDRALAIERWQPIRITWRQLDDHPERLARDIRRLVRERSRH